MRPVEICFRFCALCLVALFCASSASSDDGWATKRLVGSTLRLVNAERVEKLRFVSTDLVAATLGARGGPFTAPVFPWHLVDGKLGIGEGDSYELLEFVASSGSRITARRRSGKEAEYELEPH